jgi:hypothetical protein
MCSLVAIEIVGLVKLTGLWKRNKDGKIAESGNLLF